MWFDVCSVFGTCLWFMCSLVIYLRQEIIMLPRLILNLWWSSCLYLLSAWIAMDIPTYSFHLEMGAQAIWVSAAHDFSVQILFYVGNLWPPHWFRSPTVILLPRAGLSLRTNVNNWLAVCSVFNCPAWNMISHLWTPGLTGNIIDVCCVYVCWRGWVGQPKTFSEALLKR